MPTLQPLLNRRRLRALVLLFVLISSVYLITFSARIESGDARRLFDAVSSLSDHGDVRLDLSAWQYSPQQFDDSPQLPLESANIEPMQIVLAAPLYALAKILPGIGLVHTVWLFNVFIGAAAGCVLYLYALALGYSERAAAIAALMFAFGTAVWVYSKTFFREPLLLLLLLAAALLIERARVGGYRSIPLLVALALTLIGLILTKASSIMAFPALLILALPSVRTVDWRRVAVVVAIITALVALVFVGLALYGEATGVGARYNVLRRVLDASPEYLWLALRAYLLSPGGSFWGTSPILLLAVPGVVMLVRRGRLRYPLAIVLLVLVHAVGYAVLNGVHWFGGLSWPPRFLIPVLPFVLIGALPVIERIASKKWSLWLLAAVPLMVYSVWFQISGVAFPLETYPAALPAEAGGLNEWEGGLYDSQYLRPVVLTSLWGQIPADNAWSGINRLGYPAAFAALAVGALVLIALPRRRVWVIVPPLFAAVVFLGLRDLYRLDVRYQVGDESLHALLPLLEAETDRGDVILLGSPRYEPFFANAGKLWNAGRVIALALQPGERPSPEEPASVESDNPAALLHNETSRLIHSLAGTHNRLWLVVDGSPYLWWSARPVEHFLSSHYYPLERRQTGDLTWLIEFSTIDAPDHFAYRAPEQLTDLEYGDTFHLIGYDLPAGTGYAPGDVLSVSLYWTTDAPVEGNYTVAFFVVDTEGRVIAQIDSQPNSGFAPTSGWSAGVPVWDNRAVVLPADLAPGEYQLWVKVYDFTPDGIARDLPVTAGESLEGTVGVLPTRIGVR